MSNAKQTPCEAAWMAWHSRYIDGGSCPDWAKFHFSAGFRAGEEGKAELLEALEELVKRSRPQEFEKDFEYSLLAFDKARAAIAKHTAKKGGE